MKSFALYNRSLKLKLIKFFLSETKQSKTKKEGNNFYEFKLLSKTSSPS